MAFQVSKKYPGFDDPNGISFDYGIYIGSTLVIDSNGKLNVATSTIYGDGEYIADTNNNELVKFAVTASAVNEFTITNAATGNSPQMEVTGGDTNINWTAKTKGTGYYEFIGTDSGAIGAVIEGNHVSASPAQDDKITVLRGRGRDSADNQQIYGQVSICIDVATSDSEAGFVLFEVAKGDGTLAEAGSFIHDGTNAYLFIGDGASAGYITSEGAYDLVLGTNGGTNSGTITIVDGANGNIVLAPNGNGVVQVDSPLQGATAGVFGSFMPVTVQQDLTGAGAVSLTTYYTAVTNTGADALTLADSQVPGQLKKIKMVADPGTDSTLTFNTNATIVFADVGDYAILVWTGSAWLPVELGNDADGTSAPVYTPAA